MVVNTDEQPELPAPAPATFQAGPPSAAPVEVPDKSVADLGSRHGSEKVCQQLVSWPDWHSCHRCWSSASVSADPQPPLMDAATPNDHSDQDTGLKRKPCTASAVSCRLPCLPLQKSTATDVLQHVLGSVLSLSAAGNS